MGKKVYEKWYDGEVLRLTKRRKKGFLALIFSRFLVIVLLLILQILLFSGLLVWLGDFKPYFHFMNGLLTLVMLVYLFSCDMDPTAKLTWVFFMALFPIPISIFLLYTRSGIGHRRIKKRVAELTAETIRMIPQDPKTFAAISTYGDGTDALLRWLNTSGCFPAYGAARTRYYASGADYCDACVKELAKAQKYIFLESFLIEEGYVWGKVLEILIEKAAAGVDVRVLYDGMCEIALLPMDYNERLESFGIHAKAFAPIRPAFSTQYNYRDHRKIMVIDGRVAFTGGINLADEYAGRKERFGVWKDAGLRVCGEAVRSYTLAFLQMWNIDEAEPVWEPFVSDPGQAEESAEEGEGFVVPYSDCPIDDYKVGETVYLDIINRADRYVYIMTPYLILDGEMEGALRYAAQRGVDVRIVLPGIPDKKSVYALAKSYYRVLLDAGVKIYEYTPGFVHAKVFLCDDKKAVVGSVNLDYRSLYHHYECATYLYRTDSTLRAIAEDFAEVIGKSRIVTYETLRNESLYNKFVGVLMRFVAPLM